MAMSSLSSRSSGWILPFISGVGNPRSSGNNCLGCRRLFGSASGTYASTSGKVGTRVTGGFALAGRYPGGALAGTGYAAGRAVSGDLRAAVGVSLGGTAAGGRRCWAKRVLCFSFSGPAADVALTSAGVAEAGAAVTAAAAAAARERVLPGEPDAEPASDRDGAGVAAVAEPAATADDCGCGGGGVAVTRLASARVLTIGCLVTLPALDRVRGAGDGVTCAAGPSAAVFEGAALLVMAAAAAALRLVAMRAPPESACTAMRCLESVLAAPPASPRCRSCAIRSRVPEAARRGAGAGNPTFGVLDPDWARHSAAAVAHRDGSGNRATALR